MGVGFENTPVPEVCDLVRIYDGNRIFAWVVIMQEEPVVAVFFFDAVDISRDVCSSPRA